VLEEGQPRSAELVGTAEARGSAESLRERDSGHRHRRHRQCRDQDRVRSHRLPPCDRRSRGAVDRIGRESRRLDELIGQLLSLARLESGAVEPKRDGVGLGLAITRRAVEWHGGTVAAANHQEGGIELTIRLPLAWTSSRCAKRINI
jgi:signal transduction histidine kinase